MIFFQPKDYLEETTEIFDKIKKTIQLKLPFSKIEHIGSSSIKGALSKGDLDIFVGVYAKEFETSLEKIKTLGFTIKKNTLRTTSLCMLETFDYKIDVSVQLVELGSKFEFFLTFRDIMNSNTHLVEEYNTLKRNSINLKSDKYRENKSKFIENTLKQYTNSTESLYNK